ncbi:hypothetical protein MAPG_07034 [Magnaporthiopsis poae ATCC 64411]|uniref:NIMA-interacting protein TinC n=1 Tax=Magnaporthiopsis poae (strain ATCC 64411 / 73-15) TaxID=644358 RepID=A0A0C4E3M4_MAGP6|nr:hypothetical protein MAPG_07034 [Magnaporthiopsis poae ATCC 64411]
MAFAKPYPLIVGIILLFAFAPGVAAFGAGNIASISKIEGQNWRHGDIEDALLKIVMARVAGGEKFSKLDVRRVYFGNWLRDYSQAIDVGTVKNVSAEAIRLLLSILGFLTFGYGSREFEVTAERLGCYRPEDHIDNPKNYADNQDATQYDRRLRGPVDERVELAVDEQTGLKNYIANERAGIMTSAWHVRNLFTKCVELGRSYGRNQNKDDLYEALRLLGTGLHCLEDYFAHSNYTELALIEMGERDVFPHVGRNTKRQIPGARHSVYPAVTGTFGGVDFLHSVTGEVSDKLTQNEIQELEQTLDNNKRNDNSALKDLLDKLPPGLIGGDKKQRLDEIQDSNAAAQMDQMNVSPREPEAFTQQVQQVFRQIMPVIEFHDEIFQNISEALEKIPILPKILEQFQEQMSMWVFTQIAPFVLPIIRQIKNELMTGSSEIIESSKNEQHIVFEDDDSTDPTHSMLSKDHFTNILNEVAGKTAKKTVQWVVPQLMQAWDDHNMDVNRLMNRIISGVLHHPAQRQQGQDGAEEGRRIIFSSIEEWWNEMDEGAKNEYRRKLSREGVENGQNHKEGQHDSGHGCGKPLGMRKNIETGGTMEDRIAGAAAGALLGGFTTGISEIVKQGSGGQINIPAYQPQQSSFSENSGSGSGISSFLGGILGGLNKEETSSSSRSYEREDGGHSQSYSQYGRSDSGNRYGQAEYSQTDYDDGSQRSEYRRYEQRETSGGYEQRESSGGYEQRSERRWESNRRRGDEEEEEEEEESRGGGGGFGDFIEGMAKEASRWAEEDDRRRY